MSNGSSAVFWELLQLAVGSLDKSQTISEPLGWLLARAPTDDWFGASGFDLDEMPWQDERFEQDRNELLRIIDLAISGYMWEQLAYVPVTEYGPSRLAAFRDLISVYERDASGRMKPSA